jgi:hypothetical protein
MYLGYVSPFFFPFFFIRRMGGAYGERKMFEASVRTGTRTASFLRGTCPLFPLSHLAKRISL